MEGRVSRFVCVSTVILSALCKPTFSQNYYFVIGAFESESNDISTFAKNLINTNADSLYTINNNGRLAHFYVLKADEMQFQKTNSNPPEQFNIATPTTLLGNREATNLKGVESDIRQAISDEQVQAGESAAMSADLPSGSGAAPALPRGKYFKFTVDSYDGRTFNAPIHQVDFSQGKDLRTFESQKYIDLVKPLNEDGAMTVVCGVFGYKAEEKLIDYYNPSTTEGVYRDAQGAWVIPYTLRRLERGDVSVMYNVGFYKDAVPMLKESQQDLAELVSMMHFNPNYEIKVHAYCNGKNKRSALALNDRHRYFDIEETIPVEVTAKELTLLRAEAIRTYLADHQIDPARVKIYAWGGHDMLVAADASNSRINDRIEIEILKD